MSELLELIKKFDFRVKTVLRAEIKRPGEVIPKKFPDPNFFWFSFNLPQKIFNPNKFSNAKKI